MGAPPYDRIRRRVQADQREKEARLNPRQPPEYSEVTRDEWQCSRCGFKARYRFLRCPGCEAVQSA
jgi:lipopolysaccharide biosynthesis regulator YciM